MLNNLYISLLPFGTQFSLEIFEMARCVNIGHRMLLEFYYESNLILTTQLFFKSCFNSCLTWTLVY